MNSQEHRRQPVELMVAAGLDTIGGVQRHTINVVTHYPDSIHWHVLNRGRSLTPGLFKDRENLHLNRTWNVRGLRSRWWLPGAVQTWLLARRCRIVHFHTLHSALYFRADWIHRLGIPYVVFTYGTEILEMTRHVGWRRRATEIYKNAACVFTLSQYDKALLMDHYGVATAMIAVVPPGVDVKAFSPDLEGTTIRNQYGVMGREVVLTVGRLIERKGQDTVIKAMPQVLKACPNTTYLLVGAGPDERRFRELADTLGLARNVVFAGDISLRDVSEVYSAADVFAMISRHIPGRDDIEGFGIVFLEAAACGKPVVAGRTGGIPEAVEHNITGILVDPEDVNEVAGALVRLLTDKALRQRMGVAGRQRVETQFTCQQVAKRVAEVVESCANVKRT